MYHHDGKEYKVYGSVNWLNEIQVYKPHYRLTTITVAAILSDAQIGEVSTLPPGWMKPAAAVTNVYMQCILAAQCRIHSCIHSVFQRSNKMDIEYTIKITIHTVKTESWQ